MRVNLRSISFTTFISKVVLDENYQKDSFFLYLCLVAERESCCNFTRRLCVKMLLRSIIVLKETHEVKAVKMMMNDQGINDHVDDRGILWINLISYKF